MGKTFLKISKSRMRKHAAPPARHIILCGLCTISLTACGEQGSNTDKQQIAIDDNPSTSSAIIMPPKATPPEGYNQINHKDSGIAVALSPGWVMDEKAEGAGLHFKNENHGATFTITNEDVVNTHSYDKHLRLYSEKASDGKPPANVSDFTYTVTNEDGATIEAYRIIVNGDRVLVGTIHYLAREAESIGGSAVIMLNTIKNI